MLQWILCTSHYPTVTRSVRHVPQGGIAGSTSAATAQPHLAMYTPVMAHKSAIFLLYVNRMWAHKWVNKIFVPQFPHLYNGDNNWIHVMGCCEDWINKYLQQSQTYSTCYRSNGNYFFFLSLSNSCVFWGKFSLCSPCWPQTQDPPSSTSSVLRLQVCTTTSGLKLFDTFSLVGIKWYFVIVALASIYFIIRKVKYCFNCLKNICVSFFLWIFGVNFLILSCYLH
jgi:hypothetical protein